MLLSKITSLKNLKLQKIPLINSGLGLTLYMNLPKPALRKRQLKSLDNKHAATPRKQLALHKL